MEVLQNVRKCKSSDTNLGEWTKEELIIKVQQLQAHVQQLKNVVAKQNETHQQRSGRKNSKIFDFSRYKRRRVALKFLYLGWDYQGFAVQEETMKTIEAEIFHALIMTKMIHSRETSNYHRCGRTDKGVSAFSQVISLDLRTNLDDGPGVFEPEGYNPQKDKTANLAEMNYPQILNRILPEEIRIIAWVPVDKEFSARFSCIQRTYKYYFPKGNLNLELMQIAGNKLIGEHDFRNLCKMDVGNGVVNFKREVTAVHFSTFNTRDAFIKEPESDYDMIVLTITSQGFLWHQIRCIVAVLFAVGQENEEPEIVEALLDVETFPCKPQYSMASELPLVLFDCQYENINWNYDTECLATVSKTLQDQWVPHAIKTTIIRNMLDEIGQIEQGPKTCDLNRSLIMGVKPKVYKPLLERPVCSSLEDRIDHYRKRRRLETCGKNQPL